MKHNEVMSMPFEAEFIFKGRRYRHVSGNHYPIQEIDGTIRLWVKPLDSKIVRDLFVQPELVESDDLL